MDFCNTFPAAEREPRARDLLKQVGLEDFADKLPAAVSGGQQQTAAIARALANDPPILIADEPTGNLDSRTADAVFSLFHALVKQGKTLIMVTHDPGLAERTTRMVRIHDGQLVGDEHIGGSSAAANASAAASTASAAASTASAAASQE
jgi:putative ABC transport system ATP-binding protein